MHEKVVLIGAGSAVFTRGLLADLIQRRWDGELALVDTAPEALAVAEGLARKMTAARHPALRVTASTGRRAVLRGATVVICTIGVGGRRAWEQDVFVPRRHGLFQPVGDTIMPGGSSRALRMIPPMVAIARDVLELAPDALFFNYGNPMAPVCRAVRKTVGAPMVGLCHGVFHVAHYLAATLDAPPDDFDYTAIGMNHLTWFTETRIRGEDVLPRLTAVAEHRRRLPECDNPFSWALLRLFGAFPAVLDRHVTEFFPQFFANGAYYGKRLGVDAFSFEECIADGDTAFDEMRAVALSPDPLPEDYFDRIGGEHEQVIDIVESIRTDRHTVYSVNLPNTGQAPNLLRDAIVESPAVATAAGLKPIMQPPLPSGIAGTLATRLEWVETIVEAALEGSRDKFIQALVLDGAVAGLDAAAALADDLLAAHTAFLPQFQSARSRS